MMEYSAGQQQAHDLIERFLAQKQQQVFYLAGYAGTGKTTIAIPIAADLVGPNVAFATYTGKAAHVLAAKGCVGARTIHSLIYKPHDRSGARLASLMAELVTLGASDGRKIAELQQKITREEEDLKQPMFSLNEDSPVSELDALFIDECSMVDERMGKDLESFGTPIVVLGDPFQLPPVRNGEGYFTQRQPDYLLEEIHRQAAGSPVLQLATKVRKLEKISSIGDCLVGTAPRKRGDLDYDRIAETCVMRDYGQILVGRNKTRRNLNQAVRRQLGFTGELPQSGEKLICLRNNPVDGLLNGQMWKVIDAMEIDESLMQLTIAGDDSPKPIIVKALTAPFRGEEPSHQDRRRANEFDFGYAITVHKSQGSQWKRVAIIDESFVFGNNAKRHLYTAITRASELVTVACP